MWPGVRAGASGRGGAGQLVLDCLVALWLALALSLAGAAEARRAADTGPCHVWRAR